MPNNLQQLTAYVAPNRIGFIKFILEGYDGLAILSTSADHGVNNLILRFHPAGQEELLGVLRSLGVEPSPEVA